VFRRAHFVAALSTPGPALTKKEADERARSSLLALNAPAALAGLPVIAGHARLSDGRTVGVQFIFPDMANFGWDSLLTRL
jgi:Asp-tRNA(Asn)/Glu-tRNA(Gln) amidotransferase A subunit family amidase